MGGRVAASDDQACVKGGSISPFLQTGASLIRPTAPSADGVEHDDRDLALGLLLVLGIRRPELQRLLPQPRALRAGGGPGPRLHLRRPDLDFDVRVGKDVAIPAGVLRRAAFEATTKYLSPAFP